MSISAYVGLPGHGKSYGAVQNVIIPALKQGRVVFTNIPMNNDLLFQDFGSSVIQFKTSDIVQNPNWFSEIFIAGSVLVFDEVVRLWPSGLKANQFLDQHKEFIAEHRHSVGDDGFSTEIYLVIQDLSMLANFPRSLVETTYRMVKRISIGLDKRFRVDIYEGCVTGSKPPVSKRLRELHGGKFNNKIWQYYKSHTKSNNVGNEKRTDQRGNALGRLSIKFALIFFVLSIPFIFFGFSNLKNKYKPEHVQTVSVAQSNSTVISKPVSNKPEFLGKAKDIFLSHIITTNAMTDVFISVSFEGSKVFVSDRQLKKMGYRVSRVTDCIVQVLGVDYSGYVMCSAPVKSTGFIKSIVSGEST